MWQDSQYVMLTVLAIESAIYIYLNIKMLIQWVSFYNFTILLGNFGMWQLEEGEEGGKI